MAGFTEKSWIDEADHAGPAAVPPGTPLSGTALEDMETRLSDYSIMLAGTAAGIHNVLDYGAIGDESTDDTTAIQSAINAASNGVVFFPGGGKVYMISKPLEVLGDFCQLRGEGGFLPTMIKATAAFNLTLANGGKHMIRNWTASDYDVGEVDPELPPATTANPNYQPDIYNLTLSTNSVSGLHHIGWVHPQERGMIDRVVLLDADESVGLDFSANSDASGSVNDCSVGQINFYGTGWKTWVRCIGPGNSLRIRGPLVCGGPTSDSGFDIDYVIGVYFDDIHIEGGVDPTDLDTTKAIIRLHNVQGFVLRNGFVYKTTDLEHSLVYATRTNVGTDHPLLDHVKFDGTSFDFNVPVIHDETSAGGTILVSQQSAGDMIYRYDGQTLTYNDPNMRRTVTRIVGGAASAPSLFGTQGDIIYNTDPDATDYLGWVCVTAGNPGTWKGFGAIEA